ncbi:MAG: phenylalanine--tRNA ligase subunit alpha [Candidatus Hadarchaeota archaeon]
MLSPVEITLLKSLEVGKEYLVDKAVDITKMNRDAVLKAAHMLEEKDYAEVNTQIHTEYYLSEEGRKYLQEGLPEERVLQAVNKGITEMSRIQQEVGKKEVGIAVGWLKKKGMITIDNGEISIKSENPLQQLEEKDALKLIEEGRQSEVDDQTLSNLLKRNLVVPEEHKQIFVKLVDKPDVELKEMVADLSPEILVSGRWRNVEFLEYDIHKPSEDIFTAKMHPYERIIEECRKIFLEMGFTEIKGNYVQSSFWNFDALFQPQDHPARDMQDTFYLDKYVDLDREYVDSVKSTHENGWETGSTGWGGEWSQKKARQLVLRTHTTAITIHHLANNPRPPVKAFSFDRVYRRESIDATHLPEFDQLEGVVLDKNVGFKHLLGLLKEFFFKMGFEDIRFRPGYFPYTEPSVETEVYVEGMGWIELGGAGIFRKEVTYPLGIKDKVLAWGIGVGRLAMLRMGMKDLRRLYVPDIGWLRDFPVVKSFRE